MKYVLMALESDKTSPNKEPLVYKNKDSKWVVSEYPHAYDKYMDYLDYSNYHDNGSFRERKTYYTERQVYHCFRIKKKICRLVFKIKKKLNN